MIVVLVGLELYYYWCYGFGVGYYFDFLIVIMEDFGVMKGNGVW